MTIPKPPTQKIELELDYDEYTAIISGLTSLVYERLDLAKYKRPEGYNHIEIAEALAKGRHQIAMQLGVDKPGETDPVSEACKKELMETTQEERMRHHAITREPSAKPFFNRLLNGVLSAVLPF